MRILAALLVVVGCKEDRLTAHEKEPAPAPAPTPAIVADASTDPDMCELFFTALDRSAECAKMTDENRNTYKTIAREVQDSTERPFGKGKLAKCQMSLHLLRIDVKLDCPELAAKIPYVEIPM